MARKSRNFKSFSLVPGSGGASTGRRQMKDFRKWLFTEYLRGTRRLMNWSAEEKRETTAHYSCRCSEMAGMQKSTSTWAWLLNKEINTFWRPAWSSSYRSGFQGPFDPRPVQCRKINYCIYLGFDYVTVFDSNFCNTSILVIYFGIRATHAYLNLYTYRPFSRATQRFYYKIVYA